MIDGFSRYNQVWVKDEDQFKTAFITKWGTFTYQRMPFGLSNVRATFQKAMDRAFDELINKVVLVYQDDIMVYSRKAKFHVQQLRQVFSKCQEFGISINPKKSIFVVDEGRLLVHVISK